MTAGIASSLVNSCLSHLSKVSGVKRKKGKGQPPLDHEFGRFKLWAHGFNALPDQPKAANDPLDEVLERSKYLKEPTILLLASFASCLLMQHFKKSTSSIPFRDFVSSFC